jgi:hypothetical protein
MGTRREHFTPEKLVIGVLSTRPQHLNNLKGLLQDNFGRLENEFGPFPFVFTDYYEQEMGSGIQRYFYVFSDLVDPQQLARIKIITQEIEPLFAENGMRKINIDPGILSLSRFVLATTKDRGHRIPLSDGIFGEVTLMYVNKQYIPLEWTYADFASGKYRSLLKEIRGSYKKQLR